MTKLYPVVNRSTTPSGRPFVAHLTPAGQALVQSGRPLPLPEVTYVDWSEWERAASAGGAPRLDLPHGVGPSPR